MGLISTEVEVRLNGGNISYYENLGYKIPRYYHKTKCKYLVKQDATLLVKVTDLPKNSNVKVNIECDHCKQIIQRKYCDYNKTNLNGKYYCKKCVHTVLHSGENNNNWKSSKSQKEREDGRCYPEYTEFIKSVLARDNYTCQCCGKKNDGDIEVHHLYGYAGFPEYRTDQTQALCLCERCHKSFHLWHGQNYGYINKGNCTREQFEEWYGQAIKELETYNGELIVARKVYCIDNDTVYYSAAEACKKLNIKTVHNVYKMCKKEDNVKSVKGYHFLWYDEYLSMTQAEIDEFIAYCKDNNNRRQVICLETKEVFESLLSATLCYNSNNQSKISSSKILNACKHKVKTSCGLHWMYYDEYLEKIANNEEILMKVHARWIKVISITTGEIFNQAKKAACKYGLTRCSNITDACKGKQKTSGKLPDGTPVQWMRYEDFLKLPIEEQEEILAKNKDSSDNDGSFVA